MKKQKELVMNWELENIISKLINNGFKIEKASACVLIQLNKSTKKPQFAFYIKLSFLVLNKPIFLSYRYLPVVLTFRTMGSNKKVGEEFTKEERKELREKYMVNLEKINDLMNSLPPDMLFIMRASNLVAIHNKTLGGSSRDRMLKFTDLVINNLHQNFV